MKAPRATPGGRRSGRRFVQGLCLGASLGLAMPAPQASEPPAAASKSAAQAAAAPQPLSGIVQDKEAALIARGHYVATLADCATCHTSRGGGAPYAGGRSMHTPFGDIISTNITPDAVHGIGKYTYDDFARALRKGITRDGKRLYPAMPYAAFAKMSDDDMRALYVYMMRGVAPIAQPSEPSRLLFPFNIRPLLAVWQWTFVPGEVYQPRMDRDARWNRGAYLVQSVGHCGACHTPRGIAYQERGLDESSWRFLTGAVNENWYASNLTGDAGSGLGRVSEETLVQFFRTGHGDGSVAYGSMVETIETSLQHWTDDDLRAVAHYLKSLPAQRPSGSFEAGKHPTRSAADGDRTADRESIGASAYRSFCAQCHGADGKGVPRVYPRLAGNASVLAKDTTSLIRIALEGGGSPVTRTGPPRQDMPGLGKQLNDLQIAQALSYIRGAWGNDAPPVTTNDVATLRSTLEKENMKYRPK